MRLYFYFMQTTSEQTRAILYILYINPFTHVLTMAVIFLNSAGIFEHFFIVFLVVVECLFLLDFALFIESIALDVYDIIFYFFL